MIFPSYFGEPIGARACCFGLFPSGNVHRLGIESAELTNRAATLPASPPEILQSRGSVSPADQTPEDCSVPLAGKAVRPVWIAGGESASTWWPSREVWLVSQVAKSLRLVGSELEILIWASTERRATAVRFWLALTNHGSERASNRVLAFSRAPVRRRPQSRCRNLGIADLPESQRWSAP